MCLGIPGQIIELGSDNVQVAKVNVDGVRRLVNVGLLVDDGLAIGDWVLIHVGFAMAKIDEVEANRAIEGLRAMGRAYTDEIDALRSSRIEEAPAST